MTINKVMVFVSIVIIMFTGCAIKKGTINSYIDPTYDRGSIQSIAMFPIRNAKFAPAEARQLNKELTQNILKKNPDIEIIAPSKALRMINESGLASDWADFVEDYYTSGIADKKVLSKIAKALKVDAVFQANLVKIYQVDGGGTGSRQKALTRVTLNFSIVEIRTAKTIWEATADGIRGTGYYSEAPPVKDAIDLAMKKIKINIPNL